MTENVILHIGTTSELERLADYLHDAVFKAEDVVWSRSEGEVSIRFWREGDELPSRRVFSLLPFVHTRRFQRAECIVQWRNVRQLICQARDRLNYHCLTDVRTSVVDAVHKIEFLTEGAMELYLLADDVDGRCYDTGEVTENQFGFTTIGLGKYPRPKHARGRGNSGREKKVLG